MSRSADSARAEGCSGRSIDTPSDATCTGPHSCDPMGAVRPRRITVCASAPIRPAQMGEACNATLVPAGWAYLHSAYYDTEQLDLVQAGMALQLRDAADRTDWVLTMPDGTQTQAPAGGTGVPPDLRAMARKVLGGKPVTAFLGISRVEMRYELRGVDGSVLARVDEDAVRATHLLTGLSLGRWMRVQIELTERAEDTLLRTIAAQVP